MRHEETWRPSSGAEACPVAVEDVVDAALAVQIDGAGFMPRDKLETHLLEQRPERVRFGMGEFHEFESIGADGVFGTDFGWRRIVRKRAHFLLILFFFLSFLKDLKDSAKPPRDVCIINEFSISN